MLKGIVPREYWPSNYLTRFVMERSQKVVQNGPFRGMRYIDSSFGSAYIPKLIGTYERELSAIVEEVCASNSATIIDIGAAEGYYAIGFARRLPNAKILAYELQPEGRAKIAEMALLNNVSDQVEIRGQCNEAEFAKLLEEHPTALYFLDVEGFEENLLTISTLPHIHFATLIVETHDFIVPGITDKLVDMFSKTHSIKRILSEDRESSDMLWTSLGTRVLPSRFILWAVSEHRPARMEWLYLRPRKTIETGDFVQKACNSDN
jgi:hypothetical protein